MLFSAFVFIPSCFSFVSVPCVFFDFLLTFFVFLSNFIFHFSPGHASAGPPKKSLFFSSPCHNFHSFSPLLGVFSWNFGGVFEGLKPPEVSQDSPRTLRAAESFATTHLVLGTDVHLLRGMSRRLTVNKTQDTAVTKGGFADPSTLPRKPLLPFEAPPPLRSPSPSRPPFSKLPFKAPFQRSLPQGPGEAPFEASPPSNLLRCTPSSGPLSADPPPPDRPPLTAQNFAFFFPLPPQFSFFLPSLGGLLLNFGGVLKAGTLTGRELQTVLQNTTKIPRKGPPREGTKNENCGGRGKKARNFGLPPFGAPPFGATPFGPPLSGFGWPEAVWLGQVAAGGGGGGPPTGGEVKGRRDEGWGFGRAALGEGSRGGFGRRGGGFASPRLKPSPPFAKVMDPTCPPPP